MSFEHSATQRVKLQQSFMETSFTLYITLIENQQMMVVQSVPSLKTKEKGYN